jgi:nicotinamide mononucleotide transporter
MFLGTTYLEWSAIITTVICIWLAGQNNIHNWWIGIVSSVLYGVLFWKSQLYADVTLQVFFIVTGILGWKLWLGQKRSTQFATNSSVAERDELPITKASPKRMLILSGLAVLVAVGYGYLLHRFTNAYAPFVDSLVLTLSVIAELLLMRRQLQNWPVWVLVNALSVPLYASRGLTVTAVLYAVFFVNAVYSWWNWNKIMKAEVEPADPLAHSFPFMV